MAELATIARPYAEALFQVARKGDLNAVRAQLESRGIAASDEETLTRVAQQIRSGHTVPLGEHDASE